MKASFYPLLRAPNRSSPLLSVRFNWPLLSKVSRRNLRIQLILQEREEKKTYVRRINETNERNISTTVFQ